MKNKHAICILAFTNDLYLVGASLAGFIHKKYITKYSLNIDVVIMIDNSFEPFVNELNQIFDKIKIIDLVEIKLSPNYKIHHKYSKWLKYSINKWQALNFDEYEKILFCDTEILPLNESWYTDIFKLDAPAFLTKGMSDNYNTVIERDMITNKNILTAEDYRTCSKNFKFTIDAGLVLLKPSKILYLEYLDFVKFAEGSEGYISSDISGADETTLLLFMIFYKQIESKSIPYDYAVISWEDHEYDKQKVKGLNFLSMIKPWVKPEITQWGDEKIWHEIAESMFTSYDMKLIKKIYIRIQLENLFRYRHAVNNGLVRKVAYNYEAINDVKLKNQTLKFLNFLGKIKHNNFSVQFAQTVLEKAKLISNNMDNNTEIDQTKPKNVICN